MMKNDTRKKYVRKTVTWEGRRYEVRGETELEALEKLAELKVKLKNGDVVMNRDTTVDRWFQEWFDLYKKTSGSTEKSLLMYQQKYNVHVSPAIGRLKMGDIREANLQRILNSQAGMSFSHVSKLRIVIKGMFSRAASSRIIPFDPSAKLELPETVKRSHRSLTEDERAALLKVCQQHHYGLMMMIVLYAGLRPGELAALNWGDVDFERNEIIVHKALESGSNNVKAPKTDAGFREIPMVPELRERLWAVKKPAGEAVVTNTKGKRMDADSMYRAWKSVMRKMDIEMGAVVYRNQILQSVIDPDLTLYCLRHTFCTDLQKAGVPINVAKELMGHSSISVTANIYTHKDQETLHRNMEKFAVLRSAVTTSHAHYGVSIWPQGQGLADFGFLPLQISHTSHTEQEVGTPTPVVIIV